MPLQQHPHLIDVVEVVTAVVLEIEEIVVLVEVRVLQVEEGVVEMFQVEVVTMTIMVEHLIHDVVVGPIAATTITMTTTTTAMMMKYKWSMNMGMQSVKL